MQLLGGDVQFRVVRKRLGDTRKTKGSPQPCQGFVCVCVFIGAWRGSCRVSGFFKVP